MNQVERPRCVRRGRLALWRLFAAVLLLVLVLLGNSNAQEECRATTQAVEAMSTITLVIAGEQELAARLASTAAHRRAGMQHLCPATVRDLVILFRFPEPRRPRFHMNNVHAPLDIAFLSTSGRVVSVHRMRPGQNGTTGPDRNVAAAVELPAGRAEQLGIERGIRIEQVTAN